ncbi:COMM domain-containing protein 10-like [Paramacrobiotus metropolitanus]|uniref:COMM domain-containing protein 10-like n=1 Tax=Paramacrobiotus metropolitanus TaxID=2943436 RepID=UPI002445CB81|nr:COMM domain-containing protein 10-like [Paramacrobiotus metropolitanus]
MTAPKQLSDVNWKLNLQLSHSKMANTKTPNALVELSLGSSDCSTNTAVSEKVVIEFSKEELVDFYHKLEEMQAQLDSLQ